MVDQQSAHILVVDDNEMNRDMLLRRLKRQNYQVTLAENGQRCLEIMRQQPFDLVLLDIMMPVMNGYDTLESIKADPNLKDIPVIMISAVDDLDSVVRCIEMGAEDYLFKPFNPVLLKARISATLDKYRLRHTPSPVAFTQSGRHPAAAIIADAEAMKLGSAGPVTQAQIDILTRISNNAAKLLTQS
ncbi:MAG: hypothetical protein Kow00117_01590 [Phototrophicales bacterium]|nr:MAG: hypothetical protein CUN56_07280 [Phototrophicales bacterium]RMG78050.1 MAG: response regulator [Chloroflexota bacterium]